MTEPRILKIQKRFESVIEIVLKRQIHNMCRSLAIIIDQQDEGKWKHGHGNNTKT